LLNRAARRRPISRRYPLSSRQPTRNGSSPSASPWPDIANDSPRATFTYQDDIWSWTWIC
jgi:hypothetical protein